MESFVYDGTDEALRKAYNLKDNGVRVLCPKCRSELKVALDFESADRLGVHPGIFCPNGHVNVLIELRRDRS
jgi:hypothetical protein